jgi:hypothetical protein
MAASAISDETFAAAEPAIHLNRMRPRVVRHASLDKEPTDVTG